MTPGREKLFFEEGTDLAKYFGHRTRWAGGTKSSGFGMSTGGPLVAPSRPPGGSGGGIRSGQIIPPLSKGLHRKGRSLPGFHPSSIEGRALARQAAVLRRMAGLGLLKNALLPLAIEDFMTTAEWFLSEKTTTEPVTGPDSEEALQGDIAGYTVQCTSGPGCSGALHQWRYLDTGFSAGNLICGLPRPICTNAPLNKTWATIQGLASAPAVIAFGEHRSAFTDNVRKVYRRVGTAPETPWPPTMTKTVTVARTLSMLETATPPRAAARTKVYPRNRPLPVTDLIFSPSKPGGVKAPPRPHEPPQKGEREKKYRVVGGKLGKAYGAATEFRDFLDCMAKNIPGEPCKGVKNQLHLYAACVAKHHNSVNMPEAIACFYGQQGRDAAYGLPDRMGRPSDNPFYQRPVGPTSGFWSQPGAPSMTKI